MKKSRRVFVTLEIESRQPLDVLRRRGYWAGYGYTAIQVSANVARSIPKAKKKTKR